MSQKTSDKKQGNKGRSGKTSDGDSKVDHKTDARRKKGNYDTFSIFINRVLKNIHPDVGITKNGMAVMNSFVMDLLDSAATEGATLMRYQKAQTLTSHHIAGAFKLILPPEIAEHALEEAKNAFTRYGGEASNSSAHQKTSN